MALYFKAYDKANPSHLSELGGVESLFETTVHRDRDNEQLFFVAQLSARSYKQLRKK